MMKEFVANSIKPTLVGRCRKSMVQLQADLWLGPSPTIGDVGLRALIAWAGFTRRTWQRVQCLVWLSRLKLSFFLQANRKQSVTSA